MQFREMPWINCRIAMNLSFFAKIYVSLCTAAYHVCHTVGAVTLLALYQLARILYMLFRCFFYAARAVVELVQTSLESARRRRSMDGYISLGGFCISFCRRVREALLRVGRSFRRKGFASGCRELLRCGGHGVRFAWKGFAPVLNYVAPVAAVIAAVLVVNHYADYRYGLAVTFKGEEIGIVEDESVFTNAVSQISAQVESSTGERYALSVEPQYALVMQENPTYISTEEITQKIVEKSPELFRESFGLFVDDTLIAANESEAALQEVLDSILSSYQTADAQAAGNDVELQFVQSVDIRSGLYPITSMQTTSEINQTLTSLREEAVVYTAVAGDSPNRIANKFDMKLDELYDLNPELEDSTLYPGSEVLIRSARSMLEVQSICTEVYTEETDIPVTNINNSSMYKGETKVKSEGKAGVNEITAKVTYVNGIEVSREVIGEKVVSEPVAKEVYVGTKTKPSTAATGNWIRPVKGGYISSRYGWRTVYGERNFHKGIDFAVAKNTPIMAIDGGTVISVGTETSNGKTVRIDHGNGYVSYYAHCNKYADIQVGDKVYQGQVIAYVGMTGRATGYHVHLGLLYKGERVNLNNIYKS